MLIDISLWCLTCDIHQLVEVSFIEEGLIQSPEVTLEDPRNRVDMVGIVHHTERIAVVLEILLELCNVRLQSFSQNICLPGSSEDLRELHQS